MPPEVPLSTPREVERPCTVDGALVRLVTDEVMVWVEIWTGREWVRDTTTTVREVSMAPPASPRTLHIYGYPVPEALRDSVIVVDLPPA